MAVLHWQPFEWMVAWRFLREGRMQSLFIIGGVAIGVAVIVFMSALLQGLQANLVRRVLTAQAHIQILPPKDAVRVLHAPAADGVWQAPQVQAPQQRLKSIDQWPAVLQQIRAWPGVKVASPAVSGSTLVLRGASSRSLSLTAVDLPLYQQIVDLSEKRVSGQLRLGANELFIGTELAQDLGLVVGDKLLLQAANGNSDHFTVTAILDFGNKGANLRNGLVSLHAGQSLLGYPGGITSIDLGLHDVYAAERIAQALQQQTGLQADSWIKTNAQFFSAVQSQSMANTAIRFFVGLSVAFGIASVLVVSVVQRSKEIGILRAMGVTRGQVMRVFLLQGGLLGLGGAVCGCAIGAVALQAWLHYAQTPDGTPMFTIVLTPTLLVSAMALASLTGLVAALAPALRAARMDPVVAIRG